MNSFISDFPGPIVFAHFEFVLYAPSLLKLLHGKLLINVQMNLHYFTYKVVGKFNQSPLILHE